MPDWPYARDETWVFEPSGGGTNLRSNLLHRGSSAPSRLFHECLADFHAELEVPLQDGDNDLRAWVDQNLAPLDPSQMDTETVPAAVAEATTSTKCSQQFLVAQAGFKRRISSIVSEVVEPGQGHAGGYGAISAIQGPTFDNRMASMTGASDVLCHGTGSISSPVTSTYSAAADHHISYSELRPGGSGIWSTSAASGTTFEGLRGPVEPPASGWSQGSTINAAPAGLIRHSSLSVSGGSSRASRGTATHPRSIAERVRRGKISERMKRLQDLVPSIEPGSNTAEMLDEVVEYVKHLQLQVEELSQTVVHLKESKRAMHPD